jgi:hypothetical protein
MSDVRFVLSKPVHGGYAFWGIVRQTKPNGVDWFPDPDFELVSISIQLPNAEKEARAMIARLGGVVVGEDGF